MLGRLIRAGYVPYRLGIESVKLLPEPDDDTGKLLDALKKSLDPNNILVPGRYGQGTGDTGKDEADARAQACALACALGIVHVPPGGGRAVWFNGGLVMFYALGEDTGGAFTLFEEAIAPREKALLHLHHEEDQAFYILEGEYEVVCDGRTFAARAGSFEQTGSRSGDRSWPSPSPDVCRRARAVRSPQTSPPARARLNGPKNRSIRHFSAASITQETNPAKAQTHPTKLSTTTTPSRSSNATARPMPTSIIRTWVASYAPNTRPR